MARLDHEDQDEDEGDENSDEDHSYLAGKISELEARKQLYEDYLSELNGGNQGIKSLIFLS